MLQLHLLLQTWAVSLRSEIPWSKSQSSAKLSSAVPYSLELEALRFLPVGVFGVLLSLEPVAAALVGFIVLGETLELRTIIAILLVTIAMMVLRGSQPATRSTQPITLTNQTFLTREVRSALLNQTFLTRRAIAYS